MRKWEVRATVALLLLLVVVWVGAKIHFYRHFWDYLEVGNFGGYLADHWPYWAGMAVVGALLFVLGRSREAEPDTQGGTAHLPPTGAVQRTAPSVAEHPVPIAKPEDGSE